MQPYYSFPFFGTYVCIYIKIVAYIQDELLFKKLAFWVCLKTRCASKRDALVLATLRYTAQHEGCEIDASIHAFI